MRVLVLFAIAALVMAAPAAQSAVLLDQQYDGSSFAAMAQEFPDFPSATSYEFDDFTVDEPGWVVNKVSVYGVELGDPAYNQAVNLAFTSAADVSGIGPVYPGAYVGGNLDFSGVNVSLGPGNYWVTAWVKRPFAGGLQWFWDRTTPVTGSEEYFQNPGNYFGYGSAPIPGTTIFGTPRNMAFKIEGSFRKPGAPLWGTLETPAAVRPGIEYVLWVHYGNMGDADLPLPLLYLSNSAGVPMRIGQHGRTSTTGLALVGVSPTGAPVLSPGMQGSIPITISAPPNAGPHQLLQFSLKALLYDSTPVDWGAIEPVLRPDDVSASDPDWMAFWSNATTKLGPTWGLVADKAGIVASYSDAPLEKRADFTGVLNYSLAIADQLADPSCRLKGGGYTPGTDVGVFSVADQFDCQRNCTYVVTHGWNASWLDPAIAGLADAIKDHCPDCNVLQVNWEGGAKGLLPFDAGANAKPAGDEAYKQIERKYLECSGGTAVPDSFWDSITYVGHSYGNSVNAAIAGNHGGSGKAVILDPPNPYGGSDPNYRDRFRGGSISINTGSFFDAKPCDSPGLADTTLRLRYYAPDVFDPFGHGGALRVFTQLIQAAGTGCNNELLKGDWGNPTRTPGCYDGNMAGDGSIHWGVDCTDCVEPVGIRGNSIDSGTSEVVFPWDPNEKVGPIGEGDDHLVSTLDDLEYTIYFENAPEASAPVQEAIITDDLSSHLDWATFQLQEIEFGDKIVPIDGGSGYTGSVDIPNLRVDLTASINTQTGRAQWILRAIDPATGLPPVSPLVGFLPPDDPATHSGEAHLRFKIRPEADTPVGTLISNTASIVFDQMSPTPTAPISNTIGAFPPGEVSNPFPADGATDVAINTALSWSASRTTSYDLYIWRDGQPKPATPTAAGWPATGYQPMADFAVATTYRWQVVAKNPSGETPGPEWTFIAAPLPPVTYARSLGNGQAVGVSRAVVSAAFADSFYLEADDRSSGIRVDRPAHGLSIGMRADVNGTARTNADGERYIEATWATKNGTGWVNPLGMNRKLLGGASFLFNASTGAGQRGVLDGFGLNNIGLLVRLWGRVTEVEQASPPTWFTLDDGTGPPVKCAIPSDVTISPAWQMIAVTGISSCEKVGEELHRLLRVRTRGDIVPVPGP